MFGKSWVKWPFYSAMRVEDGWYERKVAILLQIISDRSQRFLLFSLFCISLASFIIREVPLSWLSLAWFFSYSYSYGYHMVEISNSLLGIISNKFYDSQKTIYCSLLLAAIAQANALASTLSSNPFCSRIILYFLSALSHVSHETLAEC